MQMRDWSLVIFTLLMQSSIGTVIVMSALSPVTGRNAHASSALLPFAFAAGAGGLAVVTSLLHLGHPAQAWLAVTNIRSSWLSREIIASILFVAFAMLVVVNRRVGESPLMPIVAVLLGVAAIYAMARLYMVPAQPAWNRLVTPFAFLVTALLLGAVFVLWWSAVDAVPARRLPTFAAVLLMIQIVLTIVFVGGVPHEPAAAISMASNGSTAVWLTAARIVAAVFGLALLWLLPAAPEAPRFELLAVLTFGLTVASEIAGRLLFYAGRVSVAPF
jgi:anaerobic dimethyl sulfoxide reductase subunit C (anchor subunit)